VFCQLAPLSDVLQAESCDLASTLQLASSRTQILVEQREASFYDKLWSTVATLAADNVINMTVPIRRARKGPSALRNFLVDSSLGHREVASDQPIDVEQYFRVAVFAPVMGRLIAQMDRGFGEDETRTPR
jgi:hypothetical protein